MIELAGLGPAPFGAMVLADLGADVVTVDRASNVWGGASDGRRQRLRPGSPLGRRRPQAPRRRRRGGPPGRPAPTCSSRGSGPAWPSGSGSVPTCCGRRNPRLVYGRMTGWGQDGPLAAPGRPRHQLHRARRAAGPHRSGRPAADAAAQPGRRLRRWRHAARARRAAPRSSSGPCSGEGQVVDAAMVDGAALLSAPIAPAYTMGYVLAPSAGPTCSTPARRTTTATSAPTAGGCSSARSSRSSTPTFWRGSACDERARWRRAGPGRPATVAGAEGAVRRGAGRSHPRRVGRGLRRRRRLRGAGAPVLGGRRRPAHRGPRHLGRRRRRRAAGAGAPLRPHARRARPPTGAGRAPHRRGAGRGRLHRRRDRRLRTGKAIA